MEHPRNIEWIELANDVTTGEQAARLHAHLAECPTCRAMFEELRMLHRAMQPLDATASERDLTMAVLAAAMDESVCAEAWRIGPMCWRLAASVVIAAGVGMAAGVMNRDMPDPANDGEEGVARQLGLRELQDDSPTRLSEFLFTMPTDVTVEKGAAG